MTINNNNNNENSDNHATGTNNGKNLFVPTVVYDGNLKEQY